MAKQKQTLYAKEFNFVYETKFDKFQKSVLDYTNFLFIILSLFVIMVSFTSPIIMSILLFCVAGVLKLNELTYEDKTPPVLQMGTHFEKNSDYFVHIGNAITSIEDVPNPATVMNPKFSEADGFNPDAIKYPILATDKMLLTHMFVIGTTGAGKTTFLTNILEQILILGGGCLAIDGKGDQAVYEAFWNTAVHCGREDDFLVINFNQPTESNSMNPLLKGTADEITDIIGNMLETGGDNAFWSGRALAMMKGLLSILVPLRDAGIMFDPNGKKVEVLTFSFLTKWIDIQNLKILYFTVKEANKGTNGIRNLPPKLLGTPNEMDIPLKFNSDSYNELFYYRLSKKVMGIDLSRLEQYLSSLAMDIYNPSSKIEEGTSKQHGNSFLMWNESLDLIAGRFGVIFDTAAPEIDMQDVVSNGRILYVLLPALKVDTRTLGVLGKLILGFFKQAIAFLLGDKISGSIEERYKSFSIRPRVPFWGVMDEYGAYAVEGFDNVLAQARSLKVSIAILVQEIASLKKGSEIEAQRLLGNTGLKVILKLEEQNSIKEVIEFLSAEDTATIQVNEVTEGLMDRKFNVQEKAALTTKMLKQLKGGHAYIMWAGDVVPALVRFYEPPISRKIPEFKDFQDNMIPFYEIKNLVHFIENENLALFSNETNLETQILMLNKAYNTQIQLINKEDSDFDKINALTFNKNDINEKNIEILNQINYLKNKII